MQWAAKSEHFGGIDHNTWSIYKTKWPPCCIRHIQMHFLEWETCYFYSIIIGICLQGSIPQQIRIGSDICFVPNRRQAIIWTKDGLVYPRKYASPCLNESDIELRWLWSLGPKHHGYWNINFLADAVYGLILPNVRLYYSRWPLRIPCIMLWIHPGYASDETRCRWTHYKSPASRLFCQPFVYVHMKENIKAPRHWSLCG